MKNNNSILNAGTITILINVVTILINIYINYKNRKLNIKERKNDEFLSEEIKNKINKIVNIKNLNKVKLTDDKIREIIDISEEILKENNYLSFGYKRDYNKAKKKLKLAQESKLFNPEFQKELEGNPNNKLKEKKKIIKNIDKMLKTFLC